MEKALDRLTIKGFKSVKSLEDFELKNLNVLIGANGAGKTNFIDFFRLLRAMMELSLPGLGNANLQAFIKDGGGIDDFLFNGPKITAQIEIRLHVGENGYGFKLAPTADENVLINDEEIYHAHSHGAWQQIGSGTFRPELLNEKSKKSANADHNVACQVYEAIKSWRIYHFHDTSKTASVRRSEITEDCDFLRFDAANIAPFLLKLREEHKTFYNEIVETIRLVTPFFDDFILKPDKGEKVKLRWKQRGSDYPMRPHLFSDGTLRFICLTAALLQPESPTTMIIDEPELGLHPYAIEILAELIEAASEKTQIIVSTQSPALIDYFNAENIIVVVRDNGASAFRRLNTAELTHWLDEYSLGDLWRKNVIAGGPVHE
ncbi:AAA family ATPase [Desulfonema magnum]|uniref:AAA family ATPase n=1 Tax=Desulfonema magnum TaxID=45655 RepID=A0A975BT89_9BACT|nr:AAA family ATPase [Desulfonema magnum]QTA90700.1 AAA family ATPase [Desulfonema magnum]